MITVSHDAYGVPIILRKRIREVISHPEQASADLDAIIMQLGPHEVAHFLTTTTDSEAAGNLYSYLDHHWPAYSEIIERMMFAADRDRNEDLLGDMGQS